MAQQTDAATDESTTTDLTPDDVIGKRVFSTEKYMGLGVPVGVKTARNLRGDTERVFVCDMGENAPTRFVNREVDDVLRQIESDESSMDVHEIGDVFEDVSPENYDL